MTELLEHESKTRWDPAAAAAPLREYGRDAETDTGAARRSLRRQIAQLERELSELFASSFPRHGIDWAVGAAGGPRVLGIAELEGVAPRPRSRTGRRSSG